MRLHPILHTPPPSSPNLPSERKRKTTEDQPHMREVVTEPSSEHAARSRKVCDYHTVLFYLKILSVSIRSYGYNPR